MCVRVTCKIKGAREKISPSVIFSVAIVNTNIVQDINTNTGAAAAAFAAVAIVAGFTADYVNTAYCYTCNTLVAPNPLPDQA